MAVSREDINKELNSRYDLSRDVWSLTGDDKGYISTAFISLRAEESLDRRVILRQGEYSTGQYANNSGVNNCSPVFDFTTSDIWRLLSATDWNVNDVYQKLYEIGVAPADQRVGSLLNYAAVRQISTVKALEPDLYGRINGRFQNVEFMSQFGRSGYFKIGKPKDANWDGMNHIKAGISEADIANISDRYQFYLDKFSIPYVREGNIFKTYDDALKGKPWFPFKEIIKQDNSNILSYDEWVELKNLSRIHTTWRDYTLMLMNSTSEPLRSIWQEKLVTSICHWKFDTGSISEGNFVATQILSELNSKFTEDICDDSFEYGKWRFYERLLRSKRPIVNLGHYPQESITNEAMTCVKYIIEHWGDDVPEDYKAGFDGAVNNQYKDMVFNSPSLSAMFDISQKSHGECIIPDEMLTWLLEHKDPGNIPAAFTVAADDIFTNGHSDLYAKYYKADKIDGYPLAQANSEDESLKWFKNFCEVWLKEDVQWSPCWKKIAICILKNDTTLKYAGFQPTLREQQARENAIAAFSTKQEEKEKAKAEAERLVKKIEKEKLENGAK